MRATRLRCRTQIIDQLPTSPGDRPTSWNRRGRCQGTAVWIASARRDRPQAMVIAVLVRSLCGMRIQLIAMMMLTGCLGTSDDASELAAAPAVGETATLVADPLKEIFDQVDGARLTQVMQELTGVVTVTVNGASIRLGERFSATGRKNFRDY